VKRETSSPEVRNSSSVGISRNGDDWAWWAILGDLYETGPVRKQKNSLSDNEEFLPNEQYLQR